MTVSSNGFIDFISRIFSVESIYAIESGIFVFLIQNEAFSGCSKRKSIPRSSGNESRNIRPFSDACGVSAISTVRGTFEIFSSAILRPNGELSAAFGWQAAESKTQQSVRVNAIERKTN